jgi:hypothetical protein
MKCLASILVAAALFLSPALAQSPPNTASVMVPNGGGGGGGPPTGAAGGALNGTYPNPGVASVPASALPVFARATATPANPSPVTSTTALMLGLAGSITPAQSGKVLFQTSHDITNGTASDGCVWQLMFGTGTAPANQAALTGTAAGGAGALINNANTAGLTVPASAIGYVTGLVVGTTYWFDLSLRVLTGGSCSVANVTMIAIEE